jgi:hypothetical protein
MEAEPERDLAWSTDGLSWSALNNEFLVQKILHVEEHICRLVHLAGNGEIDRRKTAEPSGGSFVSSSWALVMIRRSPSTNRLLV